MKLKYHASVIFHAFMLLLMSFLGVFLVPIAYLTRNKESNKFQSLFYWWGNDKNGIYTVSKYLPSWIKAHSLFDCYYWTAIRNPARNFSSKYLGYETKNIVSFEVLKEGKFGESDITTIVKSKDKEYPMMYMYRPLFGDWKFILKYGWKNWDLNTKDANLDEFKQKNEFISFVCYPQIRKMM